MSYFILKALDEKVLPFMQLSLLILIGLKRDTNRLNVGLVKAQGVKLCCRE